MVDDEGVHYEIGVNSEYPYRDLVIAGGEPTEQALMLGQTYSRIFVVRKEHGGMKYAIGYTDQTVIEAMTEFRDMLLHELEAPQPPEDHRFDDRKIDFAWKNVPYEVGQEAYDLNKIVLPDGTLLEVGMWLDSMPPQPRELRELSHPYKEKKTAEEIAKIFNGIVATVKK